MKKNILIAALALMCLSGIQAADVHTDSKTPVYTSLEKAKSAFKNIEIFLLKPEYRDTERVITWKGKNINPLNNVGKTTVHYLAKNIRDSFLKEALSDEEKAQIGIVCREFLNEYEV